MKPFKFFVLVTLLSCQYYSDAYSQDGVPTSISTFKAKMYENEAKDNRFLNIKNEKLLNIGDKCPDFLMEDIIRYPKNSARISDFKGKLLILDFWGMNCDPCYKAMPKNDELQALFKDKAVILPVIYNDKSWMTDKLRADIVEFWNNNTYTRNVSLPTVIDTIMGKQFGVYNTNGVPFEVWINAEGMIIGMTRNLEYMNAKEISALIRGEKTMMRNMRPIDYDYNTSLRNKNNENSTIIGQTDIGILTKHKPLVRPKYNFKTNGTSMRFLSVNYSIPNLFGFVLNKLYQISGVRTFLDFHTKDPNLFYDTVFMKSKLGLTGSYRNEWTIDNTYCYEAIVPNDKYSEKEALELILTDLCKLLDFKGEYTSRQTTLFDIVDLVPKVIKSGSERELKEDVIKFEKMNDFIDHFNGSDTRPVTLRKHLSKKGNSVLKFPLAALKDAAILKQTLNKYGLDLKKVGTAPINYFSVYTSY